MLHATWVLYTTFKFGWGPQETGWSLMVVGVVSVLMQGVLLKHILKRMSTQRLAVIGMCSASLAYVAYGLATESWMLFVIIVLNMFSAATGSNLQSIVSGAADEKIQGRTLGAVSSVNSMMAIAAPVAGAGMLALVSDAPRGDIRLGLPFFVGGLIQMLALGLAIWHFQRQRSPQGWYLSSLISMTHERILILDFGSQVTQLIARRVREAHVFCEVHPCDVSDEWIRNYAADGSLKGIILSGSHASVTEDTTDRAPAAVFELGVPVLGICYGMQTMAQQLGGKVETGHTREFGFAAVRARGHTALAQRHCRLHHARGRGHAQRVDEPWRQGD